ncbi:MAG TPA: hypothetical protein DHU63_02035 [Candidatus Marinimicrobia bacterium]|nr:hypothetical protein [Candidatus Neomarinimicrobiota bacterium]
MNNDFTLFLNKIAMGMVTDHPLAHWLLSSQKSNDTVLSLLNQQQAQHLENWILIQLANAKTWGNA